MRCKTKRSVGPAIRAGIVPLAALLLAVVISAGGADANQKRSIPSADAGRGPCTVDFRVIGSQRKPVAKAWIYVEIKHGFLGLKKIELQVPTDSDGRARVTGLSFKTRKDPLAFRVQHGDDYRVIYHYPAGDCDARFIVALPKTQNPKEDPRAPENGQ